MTLFAPAYYKKFKCIADQCTHSCCIGWEIDIDGETAELYQALAGDVGDRIRQGIRTGEDGACFALRPDGRCPNLDDRGLCRIIAELGEDWLCDICREHPRFYNRIGDRMECGVGASCEAAAALILSEEYADIRAMDGELCIQNNNTCETFDAISARKALYAVLGDRTTSYADRLAAVRAAFATSACLGARLPDTLEYLDAAHKDLFEQCFGEEPILKGDEAILCERFLAYLIYRHAAEAETAWEHRLSVGLALELERLFRALIGRGIDPVKAAVTVSEEMEYSEDNLAVIRAALAKL